MPTTVMADRPTPVNNRVRKRPAGPHTSAFRSENPEYQTTVEMSARLRPTRSENQPPQVAPTNIPTNVADVTKLIVAMERFQYLRTAGAAYENVLMSPSSKKKRKPRVHSMRRCSEPIGSRSRRAAADGRRVCTVSTLTSTFTLGARRRGGV